MYLPENNAQMFDILAELRVYAAMNGLPRLAEQLDDALVLLTAGRGPGSALRNAAALRETL
jgi:hypothetical protein